jgi:hypothetical protein
MVEQQQKRGRRIAMTGGEIDEFLAAERTCRLATVSVDMKPHVTAVWFIWDGSSLWFHSLVKSQRWVDLERNPWTSVIVDTGHDYGELRGVEFSGQVVAVGDAPRAGPGEHDSAELVNIERRFALKYRGQETMSYDGKHGWLRLSPSKIVSWDFKKIGQSAS